MRSEYAAHVALTRSEYAAHVALARAARYAPQVARNQASAILTADRARRAKVRREKLARTAFIAIGAFLPVVILYTATGA